MTAAVHAFPEDEAPARRLAEALGVAFRLVRLHEFPDGETLITVPETADTVIAYRSLGNPNCKLMPLLQAADAWRRAGAKRLVLVAPYMPYLRQDAVFAPGQALSRDVLGELLGSRFNRILTVDPHLHRTHDLDRVFAPATVSALSAASALASALGRVEDVVVVGPDEEAEPWAAALAAALRAPHASLRKRRRGDRLVELEPPPAAMLRGRRVILVDDICSSGATLEAALRTVAAAGARSLELAVTHALFDLETERRLCAAGAGRVVSTDSCPHRTNLAHLDRLLADALTRECAAEDGVGAC